MNNPFGTNRDPNGQIIGPRYDSKPTQPKDPGEMSRDEEDALFDATLERDEVAEMVWEAVIDEISPAQAKEIVTNLFRRGGNFSVDNHEAGRLLYVSCSDRVEKIVEGEEHNTDMGRE